MSSSGHIYLHFKYHPWCMLGCCHFVAHVDNSPSFIPFSSSCLFYLCPAEPHVQNKMFSITLLSQFPLNHLVLTKSTNTPLQTISILFCFFSPLLDDTNPDFNHLSALPRPACCLVTHTVSACWANMQRLLKSFVLLSVSASGSATKTRLHNHRLSLKTILNIEIFV